MKEDYKEVTCTIEGRTVKAVLICTITDESTLVWVPKSVCSHGVNFIDDLHEGDEVTLRIATWFCDNNKI